MRAQKLPVFLGAVGLCTSAFADTESILREMQKELRLLRAENRIFRTRLQTLESQKTPSPTPPAVPERVDSGRDVPGTRVRQETEAERKEREAMERSFMQEFGDEALAPEPAPLPSASRPKGSVLPRIETGVSDPNSFTNSSLFFSGPAQPGRVGTQNFTLGLTSEFIAGFSSEQNSEIADTFNLRETELALGGYVDPYHRADILFTWNGVEDEVAIEEGYLTLFNLPEGFRARVGKFRSRVSRINGLHFADLPWVTLPKVNETFLGEEGFGQAGARLTYISKPRGKYTFSLDLEAFQGDSETIVDPTGLVSDPTGAGAVAYDGDLYKSEIIQAAHLQNHFQLDEVTDFEFGYSRLQANNDKVKLDGVDLTWRKLNQPGRNEWLLRWEGMKVRRDELSGTGNDDRLGWYLWGERRFDRNRAAGFRVDRVEDLNPGGAANTDSWLAYLTYYPTEFSWYRLQYQEDTDAVTNVTDKQVYLQFRWQIGVDRHALQ